MATRDGISFEQALGKLGVNSMGAAAEQYQRRERAGHGPSRPVSVHALSEQTRDDLIAWATANGKSWEDALALIGRTP